MHMVLILCKTFATSHAGSQEKITHGVPILVVQDWNNANGWFDRHQTHFFLARTRKTVVHQDINHIKIHKDSKQLEDKCKCSSKKTKSITDKQASVSSYRYVAGQAIVVAQVVSCRGHLQRPAVDARRHRRVRFRPAPDPGFQRQHLAQLIGPDSWRLFRLPWLQGPWLTCSLQ